MSTQNIPTFPPDCQHVEMVQEITFFPKKNPKKWLFRIYPARCAGWMGLDAKSRHWKDRSWHQRSFIIRLVGPSNQEVMQSLEEHESIPTAVLAQSMAGAPKSG